MKLVRYGWRDWSALAALLLVLIVCLPIFLCMPLWVDATFYDICARTIQRGGVLYRDTFDTNLPGMAWLHLAVRSLFGWSSEVLRAADFLVVAAIAYLLARWDPRMSRPARIWTVVALLTYYFSTSEWCQNQRDVWMLLPCLSALYLRRWQLLSRLPASRMLLLSSIEGLLWGAAVWIKPMALVPAVACWLVSVRFRHGESFAWRAALRDGIGLLAGGLLAGGAGIFWLWQSGAWASFWDIMLNWNPEYHAHFTAWPRRWMYLKAWCVGGMPWCLVQVLALPLAGIRLVEAIRCRRAPTAEQVSQTLLATLYLSWFTQVLALQGWYYYHLTPLALLGVALVAMRLHVPADLWWRLAFGFHLLLFVVLATLAHPVLRPQRLATWWACVTEGSTYRLRGVLTLTPQQGVIGGVSDWEDLERVAVFLRTQEMQEGELICLHEATMSLYLEMDRMPPVRYLFYSQATGIFRVHREQVLADLSASRARYAVSDLAMSGWRPRQNQTDSEARLPPYFSESLAETFPWSEPVVFRSGRYAVHQVTQPIHKLWP